MYSWNEYLCIKNNLLGDVYQYQNGKFICSVCFDEDGETALVFDKNDQVLTTGVVTDEIIGYADNGIESTEWNDEIFESNKSVVDEQGDLYVSEILRPRITKNE